MILASVTPDERLRYWRVKTSYHEAIVAQFKAMPGCFWEEKDREWIGPSEAVKEVLHTLEKAKVVIVDWPNIKLKCWWIPYDQTGLYDYQCAGVNFLTKTVKEFDAALLADDMGLGKTAQTLRTLAACRESSFERQLVICPAVACVQWVSQAKKWLNEDVARVGEKLSKKLGGGKRLDWGGLGVISYDGFRAVWKDLAPVSQLVLDEGHYLSSLKSLRSKAVRGYLEKFPYTQKIMLTGTPMTARPKDLWNPLDLLFPRRFGSFFSFARRYCDAHQEEIKGLDAPVWNFDGASNLEELGRRLQSGLMLRRVKSEVLELPERQRITWPVELPERAAKALAKATSFMSSQTEKDVGKILSAIEEHKVKAALELANDLIANGRRPLLFTLRKDTAKQLSNHLSCPVVTGEDDANDRAAILRESNVGVATIYSVTTGIDLTHFDTAIFVGLDWVPSNLLQAEARLHRIGQESKVSFYYLIGMKTLDEAIRAKVIERLEHFETLVGNSPNERDLATALRGGKTEDELIAELFAMSG